MAYTLADVEALEAAIKTGASKVKYADKEVTYRSYAEMKAILSEMKAELGLVPVTKRLYTNFDKGLDKRCTGYENEELS